MLFCAVLSTAYTAYKALRLVLEYRTGVSVRFSRRYGPDYDRATRPWAFWWAMGIEAVCLLLAASVTVLFWAAIVIGWEL